MKRKTVIFVCSFNSVRSPIAEGLLRYYAAGLTPYSAGVAPVRVRPGAVQVMKEVNIDISGHIPSSVYQYRDKQFDYVVTMCDNARQNALDVLKEGDRFYHRNFTSPQEIGKTPEEILGEYRTLRDDIGSWLADIFPEDYQVSGTDRNEIAGERQTTSVFPGKS